MSEHADDVELELPKLRCAAFHAGLEVDPIGSTGAYDGFLCVEVAPPWESDISRNEPYVSVLDGAKVAHGPDGRVWRPQALLRSAETIGPRRVLAFDRPASSSGGPFRRREWLVGAEMVADLCQSIIEGVPEALGRFEGDCIEVADDVLDLLICTHGRRDICCGSSGTSLHAEVTAGSGPGPTVRVWRTSHTGGHRFAPTALTFPDGYAWAHLDAELLRDLMERDGDVAAAARNCRGASSLPGGPAQVADRAALTELGWRWAGCERKVEVIDFDRSTLTTTMRVTGALPGDVIRTLEVVVDVGPHIAKPTCGITDEPEYEMEHVWTTTSVRWM